MASQQTVQLERLDRLRDKLNHVCDEHDIQHLKTCQLNNQNTLTQQQQTAQFERLYKLKQKLNLVCEQLGLNQLKMTTTDNMETTSPLQELKSLNRISAKTVNIFKLTQNSFCIGFNFFFKFKGDISG